MPPYILWILALWISLYASGETYRCHPHPPKPFFPPGIDQIGDPGFCPELKSPAYRFDTGPRVLFDEGHHNFSRITPQPFSPAAGNYFAFAELLRADGLRISANRSKFTPEVLAGADILVLSHALPAPYLKWSEDEGRFLSNPKAFTHAPAYTAQEVSYLKQWVANGGGLLINVEHVPFIQPMMGIIQAFGLSLNPHSVGGYPIAPNFRISTPTHPIFQGRNHEEALPFVPFVAGGSDIRIAPGVQATRLLEFPPLAFGFAYTPQAYYLSFLALECKSRPSDSDAGNPNCAEIEAQANAKRALVNYSGTPVAVAVNHGKGRVLVFTEHSTLTSQLILNPNGTVDPYGGLPKPEVRQLVLNSIHWLARVILP